MVLSGHVTPMLGGKVEIEETDEEGNRSKTLKIFYIKLHNY